MCGVMKYVLEIITIPAFFRALIKGSKGRVFGKR